MSAPRAPRRAGLLPWLPLSTVIPISAKPTSLSRLITQLPLQRLTLSLSLLALTLRLTRATIAIPPSAQQLPCRAGNVRRAAHDAPPFAELIIIVVVPVIVAIPTSTITCLSLR
jgi:hypothetical protein